MGTVRLLLALSVVISHSAPLFGLTLVGGKLAVQAFFIVSGFYMSLILNEKYPATREGNWLFYSNRFLRIYPVYWAILVITLMGVGAFYAGGQLFPSMFPARFTYVNNLLASLGALSADQLAYVIATNIGLFGMDWAYFMRFDPPHLAFSSDWSDHSPAPTLLYPVSPAWSLGIEVSVYAIAPLIFRRSTSFLALLFILPSAARAIAFSSGLNTDPWTNRFFLFEIGLFALGALLYRAYRTLLIARVKRIGFTSLAAGTAAIIAYQFYPNVGGAFLGFGLRELLFLVPFATCVPAIFAVSKSWAIDRWLGDLSYPLYLSHGLVLLWFRGEFGATNAVPVLACLAVATAFALAIDAPIERWRQARIAKGVASSRFMTATRVSSAASAGEAALR